MSVIVTYVPVRPTVCVASSTLIVTTQSLEYFHTCRSIVLNRTWPINQGSSRSQARTPETIPTGAAMTTPMVSTYAFDEHMLDIHLCYAPSLDSQSPATLSASSMTSTVPMIPHNLTFEEYLLVFQQQNSQVFRPPQVPVNPPHHYDVVDNPVYSFPVDPYHIVTHK